LLKTKKAISVIKAAASIRIVRLEDAGTVLAVTLAVILNMLAALIPPGKGWLYSMVSGEVPTPFAVKAQISVPPIPICGGEGGTYPLLTFSNTPVLIRSSCHMNPVKGSDCRSTIKVSPTDNQIVVPLEVSLTDIWLWIVFGGEETAEISVKLDAETGITAQVVRLNNKIAIKNIAGTFTLARK
jgi:hypothetical protein